MGVEAAVVALGTRIGTHRLPPGEEETAGEAVKATLIKLESSGSLLESLSCVAAEREPVRDRSVTKGASVRS